MKVIGLYTQDCCQSFLLVKLIFLPNVSSGVLSFLSAVQLEQLLSLDAMWKAEEQFTGQDQSTIEAREEILKLWVLSFGTGRSRALVQNKATFKSVCNKSCLLFTQHNFYPALYIINQIYLKKKPKQVYLIYNQYQVIRVREAVYTCQLQ